ncbi:MAG: Smr/MutS family protein [Methylococcales bacterium]
MAKKIISSEDRDLFRQSVGKVRKINTDNIAPTATIKPKPFPIAKLINTQEHLREPDKDQEIELVSLEDSLSFLAPGLQNKVLKKLRQGYYGDAAELDLHGFTSTEAQRQLLNFLQYCVENGHRCAHIIHGKGYRSSDNHPVLKNNLNYWLRQHKAVQAFCSASPKHGGTGALFVLLQLSEKI